MAILAAIERLGDRPRLHGLATESEVFEFEVREMPFGLGRRPSHRVLFTMNDEEVFVFAVRHVSRGPITPDDFERSET